MALQSMAERDCILEMTNFLSKLVKMPVFNLIINLKETIDTGWGRSLISILNISECEIVSMVCTQSEKQTETREFNAA